MALLDHYRKSTTTRNADVADPKRAKDQRASLAKTLKDLESHQREADKLIDAIKKNYKSDDPGAMAKMVEVTWPLASPEGPARALARSMDEAAMLGQRVFTAVTGDSPPRD